MVELTDLNFLSVLQYAVEVLKVKHIIVCGHYGCGGVLAAMNHKNMGMVNKWLFSIKEVYSYHAEELIALSEKERGDRLVELNVMAQVKQLSKTSIVQKAWEDRTLQIHGWVYGLENGIIKDLDVMMNSIEEVDPIFRYENL